MEGFDFDDHNGFRIIKKLFRVIEIFIVLLFLTWTFRHLPSAVRISGEYLRRLVNFFAGHLFVFFLANIIVLILIFKSRNLFLHNDLIRDISEATTSEELFHRFSYGGGGAPQAEEIVYQDKETILVEVTKVRVHRRSQSETECGCAKKLRSETERRRRVVAENKEVVEEMSNEEFQRSIEEFIAKQIKFHQQEKLAIVCK